VNDVTVFCSSDFLIWYLNGLG